VRSDRHLLTPAGVGWPTGRGALLLRGCLLLTGNWRPLYNIMYAFSRSNYEGYYKLCVGFSLSSSSSSSSSFSFYCRRFIIPAGPLNLGLFLLTLEPLASGARSCNYRPNV